MNDCTINQEILSYLKYEKHFSEHTAKCYGADLQQYAAFLIGDSDGAGDEGSGNWSGDPGGTATPCRAPRKGRLGARIRAGRNAEPPHAFHRIRDTA